MKRVICLLLSAVLSAAMLASCSETEAEPSGEMTAPSPEAIGCGSKPIVAAKISKNSKNYNVFLCESCLLAIGKIVTGKVVGSIDERYPIGFEIGRAEPVSRPELTLDDFTFDE